MAGVWPLHMWLLYVSADTKLPVALPPNRELVRSSDEFTPVTHNLTFEKDYLIVFLSASSTFLSTTT